MGPVSSGWSAGPDDGVATAGGFVVTVKAPDTDQLDRMDVRALDTDGSIIDSSAAWEAERQASQPGVTVAEALAAPEGTAVIVRGILLALPGEAPLFCDDIDRGPPPRCRGSSLQVDSPAPLPLTKVKDGAISLVTVVMTGVISAGFDLDVLHL